LTADGAVASPVVVVVDEVWQGCGSLIVAGEDLPVGPLVGEGSVEAFDLAVLPRAVRSDELVLDIAVGEELTES
jgi:hypothetical protein